MSWGQDKITNLNPCWTWFDSGHLKVPFRVLTVIVQLCPRASQALQTTSFVFLVFNVALSSF